MSLGQRVYEEANKASAEANNSESNAQDDGVKEAEYEEK